ncbi:hypothetical protein ACQUWM_09895 [Marinobacter sp. DUT-3]|uniref:hypothetical protein n=1 Tax=unclassified Marinobacter TaxID=83889 RepID=UPI00387B0773
MMKRLLVAAMTASLLPLAAQAASDHAPAPMKAAPQKPLTADDLMNEANASRRSESADSILERFQRGMGQNNPRMAVFWNREFNDQVSDWASRRRVVVSGAGSLRGEVPEGDVNLDSDSRAAVQSETRSSRRSGPAAPAFDLQSGFVSQLNRAGVKVVDRDAIMRITDNALEDGTFERLSPDQARLEMRALDQHADYLLVLSEVASDDFQIRVLNVKDGSVRTMVSSNGMPPETEEDRRWIATENGFEKREKRLSMRDVGQELALQTLAEL